MGIQLARQRSAVYKLLTLAFMPPNTGLWDPEVLSFAQPLRAMGREFSVSLVAKAQELACYLDGVRQQPTLHQDLTRTYTHLFLGPGRPAVYPYESCYRDPGSRVMGPWAVAAQKAYAAEGLALAPNYRDLPDHVAAELAFMAYLVEREAMAWEQGDIEGATAYRARQSAFLRDHLGCWVPAFCQNVLTHTDHRFYIMAARLLQSLLAAEMRELRPENDRMNDHRPQIADRRGQWSAVGGHWSLILDPHRCTLCGVCADACEAGALALEGGATVVWLRFHPGNCTGCDACRRLCPTRAIRSVVLAAEGAAECVLTESPVVVCQGCGAPLMPQASLAYLEHRLRWQGTNFRTHLTLCPACRHTRISTGRT
jgi:TorA maturation chaperone TorD/NAD-dependent dihydropyrimidine dehydrogenase PreA subunit